MTLAESDIGQITHGKITAGTNGTISSAEFAYLSGIAKAMYLDVEGTGLPATVYDYCHGLLILHLYEVGKGHTGYSSESQEGYQYSQTPGKTGWLAEYRNVISTWNKNKSTTARPSLRIDNTRADANMAPFKLDQSPVPSYFREVGSSD